MTRRYGTLTYALPSRRYRSAWFGIIIHSVETVFFIFIALGLVLGLVIKSRPRRSAWS